MFEDAESTLPWAYFPGRRCKARLTKERAVCWNLAFWGRCELIRDHDGDHALERGLVVPQWNAMRVYVEPTPTLMFLMQERIDRMLEDR